MSDYLILGVLQGIFEWLPISSEGVVSLAGAYLLNNNLNAVDVALFLHLGTLGATLIYFRQDWWRIITFKEPRLMRFLVITTVVSLSLGYPLYQWVSNVAVGSSLLLLTGFALLFTAYFQHRQQRGILHNSSDKLAIMVGVLQGLAVIPGFSRSGSTIFGLSLGNYRPEEILRISYLMSAPVIVASSTYLIIKEPVLLQGWPALLASFIVGWASLVLLMKAVGRINFKIFALIFATLCLIGGVLGFIV